MTDSSAAARNSRQAVAVADGSVCLELAADEFIFPISPRGSDVKLYFHMTPYQAEEVSPWYDSLLIRRKRLTRTEQAFATGERADLVRFIDRHFLRLSNVVDEDGSEPPLERQKAWLDANADVKAQVFREGYDMVGIPPENLPEGAPDRKAVLVFSRPSHEIPTQAVLVDGNGTVQTIRVTHVMDRLVEADRQGYERSVQIVENSRRNEVYTHADWKAITDIYDRRIREARGAVLRGAPCVAANRDEWIRMMPFSYKVYTVSQAIASVDLKNA